MALSSSIQHSEVSTFQWQSLCHLWHRGLSFYNLWLAKDKGILRNLGRQEDDWHTVYLTSPESEAHDQYARQHIFWQESWFLWREEIRKTRRKTLGVSRLRSTNHSPCTNPGLSPGRSGGMTTAPTWLPWHMRSFKSILPTCSLSSYCVVVVCLFVSVYSLEFFHGNLQWICFTF